ncbi:MAG: hypothetical protein IMW91_08395 [Firmicutes bacterium]|nr:hypothetical protein [Bacillota bacterium]
MRVALAQIKPQLGQWSENLDLHRQWIAQAKVQGAQLVVFPELAMTGYTLKDLVDEVAISLSSEAFASLAALSMEIDVVTSFVEESNHHVRYISTAYLSKGRLVHCHRKIYPVTYGMFDEMRYFGKGDQVRTHATDFGEVGLLVCEDAWHPALGYLLSQQGAELLIVPSCSPLRGVTAEGWKSIQTWEHLLIADATLFGCWVFFCNRVGYEDGVGFAGRSMVIDPFGEIVSAAPVGEETLLLAECDDTAVHRARLGAQMLRDEDAYLVLRELQATLARRGEL